VAVKPRAWLKTGRLVMAAVIIWIVVLTVLILMGPHTP
jgi:hypothetical protein